MWPIGQVDGIKRSTTNFTVFTAVQSVTTTNGWVSWTKPFGVSWVYIFLQAAGGGGGKGAGGAATVASGGGGAGGNSKLLVPAFLLPDTLYVRPGSGGAGSTTSANATAGTQSYVSIQPNTTTANLVLTQAGGGGGGNSSGAGGTAGNGGNGGNGFIIIGAW